MKLLVVDDQLDLEHAVQPQLADMDLDVPLVLLQEGAGAHRQVPGGGGVEEVVMALAVLFQAEHGQGALLEPAVEDEAVLIFLITMLWKEGGSSNTSSASGHGVEFLGHLETAEECTLAEHQIVAAVVERQFLGR